MAHAALTDVSIKNPLRLLCDAVRDLLDASPSDAVPDQPAGTIIVDRAYYPEVKIEDIEATMISAVPGPMESEQATHNKKKYEEMVFVFVHRRLDKEPASLEGKAEIDEFLDFVQRVGIALSFGDSRRLIDSEENEHSYLKHGITDIVDEHLGIGVASVRIDVEYEVYA